MLKYLLVGGHGGTVLDKNRVKDTVGKAHSVDLADMANDL